MYVSVRFDKILKVHYLFFFLQISGRKQVILFEPHDNTRLYEGHIPEAMLAYNGKEFSRKKLVDSTSMVMSPVDLAKVNFQVCVFSVLRC